MDSERKLVLILCSDNADRERMWHVHFEPIKCTVQRCGSTITGVRDDEAAYVFHEQPRWEQICGSVPDQIWLSGNVTQTSDLLAQCALKLQVRRGTLWEERNGDDMYIKNGYDFSGEALTNE